MGGCSWVKDLPSKVRLTEPPTYKPEEPWRIRKREILLDTRTWKALDSYDTSTPTGPSPGRIYKKRDYTLHSMKGQERVEWHDDEGWVYFVIDAPDGDGQLHVPYRAVIVD